MAMVHDLVLVHIDNSPAFFARIEAIEPDVKPGWWQVTFLALLLPLQVNTWILDSSQVEGAPFTMGGTPIRIEKVEAPAPPTSSSADDAEDEDDTDPPPARGGGKVVSLAQRRKG